MTEWLTAPWRGGLEITWLKMAARLLAALALGAVVARIYRFSQRRSAAQSESFWVSLVLLTVVIAMSTQVIGDNIARAFSLAGAQTQESDQLFQRDKVWTIHLIVTPEEWKKIEPANAGGPGFGPPPNQVRPAAVPAGAAERGPRFGPPQVEFPEVRAIFKFEGQTVGEMGLRYKGNSTYMAARNSLRAASSKGFTATMRTTTRRVSASPGMCSVMAGRVCGRATA
jgi:hypothetical protein